MCMSICMYNDDLLSNDDHIIIFQQPAHTHLNYNNKVIRVCVIVIILCNLFLVWTIWYSKSKSILINLYLSQVDRLRDNTLQIIKKFLYSQKFYVKKKKFVTRYTDLYVGDWSSVLIEGQTHLNWMMATLMINRYCRGL